MSTGQSTPAEGGRDDLTNLPSRRALRDAERARAASVPTDDFIEVAKFDPAGPAVGTEIPINAAVLPDVPGFGLQPSAATSERDAERAARRERKTAKRRSASLARMARGKGSDVPTTRLRHAERRLVTAGAAPKRERKNPISVLVTMVAVGGLFALAGLPAYAELTPQVDGAAAPKTDADAQSLHVASDVNALTLTRDGYTATSAGDLEAAARDALRAAQNAAYLASGARELGDDYPWPYELTDDMGGGLSPLNYYYRECVDFVAWRLNRDQGSTAAPFKWVWSNLTPYGGNGGQWQYNWERLGRTVSNVPIPGAVAYTGGNHVAYVKQVLDGGYVILEEYNYVPGAYSQRVIHSSQVVSFLYPP